MKKILALSLAAAALAFASCGGGEIEVDECTETSFEESYQIVGSTGTSADSTKIITITDCAGAGIGDYSMTKDVVYVLDGLVFVNDGQTLEIEAGTIIKGKAGQGEDASALIVARGGTIMAEGTSSDPIIFTAEEDAIRRDVAGDLQSEGTYAKDLGAQWGGIIILGNAGLNSSPGETQIEGISTSESRGLYGGDTDTDNSGTLKYVSIRHGGTDIGAGNEINGLTLGGVGSGTTLEYIEVIANEDDGIEFFGGTARLKYALVANAGDDSYDYDEGWRGFGQFWVSLNSSDHAGEHDGGTDPETATPYATPTIYNVTYIGGTRVLFRDNAGGTYANSIFQGFESVPAISIEDIDGQDSRQRYEDGDLALFENTFALVEEDSLAGFSTDSLITIDATNGTSSSSVVSASSPVPSESISSDVDPSDESTWFTSTDYRGAFDETNWAAGWTMYYGNYGLAD